MRSLPRAVCSGTSWLVQEQTALGKDFSNPWLTLYQKVDGITTPKFHVQRVDMVINPPWNLPFLGAKGLTSPEQTATDSHIDKTIDGPEVKAKDEIIASTWNLVDRSLTSAKIRPLSGIVPSTIDTKYSVELADGKVIGIDTISIVQLSSSTRVEPSSLIPNPVRIIPGSAGIVQQAKMLKEKVFILDSDGALMSTQEYMQKVVEDVGGDDDFKSGA
ncbi:hypothetical protein Tco_0522093 [Tanacetum coccineum]